MRSTVLCVSFLAASALALPQAQPSSASAAATSAASSASASATASDSAANASPSASASANMTAGGPGQPVPYQQGPYGLQNANCSNYNLTIPINSTNFQYQNVDEQYSNQSYVTGTFLDLTTDMKGWAAQHLTNQTYQLNQTYYIAATYCSPKTGARENASLPVLTHGVSFDGSYWDFSYGDAYSVQKQLASWGYPSLRYDRLGCGNSTVPNNGFQDVQTQTEVSIYKQILNLVRNSTEIGGRSWNRTVGVGHSFGSIINQAVTVTNPELLDGVVLTGYSAYQGAVQTFTAAATFTIANSTGRSKFASYPPEWLVTGSATALMFDFFRPPAGPDGNFALEAFNQSREAEGPVTLGTLTSMSTVGGTASNFTKPVFVVTGAEDLPFCGGNCSSISPSLADGVKQQYPGASTYDTFSPNNTGHGIVAHYSGPLAAQRIAQFLIDTGL